MAEAGWDDSEHFKECTPVSGVLAFSACPAVSGHPRCYTSLLDDLEPNTGLSVSHLFFLVQEVAGTNDPQSPFNL